MRIPNSKWALALIALGVATFGNDFVMSVWNAILTAAEAFRPAV